MTVFAHQFSNALDAIVINGMCPISDQP